MRRRQFIALLGANAAAGPIARAQQLLRHIAVLVPAGEDDPINPALWGSKGAFEQGLAQQGWTRGRNAQIDYHWAIDSADKTKAAIAELLTVTRMTAVHPTRRLKSVVSNVPKGAWPEPHSVKYRTAGQ